MTAQEAKHQVKLAEWKERDIACRGSGQSVQAWCEAQGIHTKTYYNWERNVLQAAGEQMAAREEVQQFMELSVPAPKAKHSAETSAKLAARIYTGNTILWMERRAPEIILDVSEIRCLLYQLGIT